MLLVVVATAPPGASHLGYVDIEKKKKIMKGKRGVPGGGARSRGAGLGQVAVGVLLPVDALQVFLLYQDVDAFLEQRKEKGKERTRHHTHRKPASGVWRRSPASQRLNSRLKLFSYATRRQCYGGPLPNQPKGLKTQVILKTFPFRKILTTNLSSGFKTLTAWRGWLLGL